MMELWSVKWFVYFWTYLGAAGQSSGTTTSHFARFDELRWNNVVRNALLEGIVTNWED